MTEQEVIEKVLRPNSNDLLVPNKYQIVSAGFNWIDTCEGALGTCTFSFHKNNGYQVVESFADKESYILALLQPIPNFSTAMQFLEKGAVLTQILDGFREGKRSEYRYKINEGRIYLGGNKFWWDILRMIGSGEILEQMMFEGNFKYTPWIDEETGETIQEIKDFCDEILKSD